MASINKMYFGVKTTKDNEVFYNENHRTLIYYKYTTSAQGVSVRLKCQFSQTYP